MILRPVRPVSPCRAADDKAPGGVDEILGLLVEQLRGDHRADHMLQHILAKICVWDTSGLCWVESTTASTRHRTAVLVLTR